MDRMEILKMAISASKDAKEALTADKAIPMTGGIYPGPGLDRQCRPLRRSDALAILAICAAIVALAVLGAVL